MADSDPANPQDYAAWRGRSVTHAMVVLAVQVWRWNGDRAAQRPYLGRWAAHVALLLVFVAFLALWGGHSEVNVEVASGADLSSFSLVGPLAIGGELPQGDASLLSGMRSYYRSSALGKISRQAEPHTHIPVRPRLEITTYTVQPGDTTESIAAAFGLDPTTIMWSNPALEKAPDLLKVGQELVILPVDGVYHQVIDEDTAESIAEKYSAAVEDILACPFNQFDTQNELVVGSWVIVPEGTKPYERREVVLYSGPVSEDVSGHGAFYWPTSGYISQGFWYGHRAIDIAKAVGEAVMASDTGYVSFAGWTDIGYGYLVVIDHANGFQTYYAHLSNIYVYEGQAVDRGAVIGAMGSSGNSTGPHLHFEIRFKGYLTNPLRYLP